MRAIAVHPGGIMTELGRHMTEEMRAGMLASISANQPESFEFKWKTIPQGAATSVWTAIVADANEVGGLYCEDCHLAVPEDSPTARHGVRAYALDAANAKALWELSEEMVGERF